MPILNENKNKLACSIVNLWKTLGFILIPVYIYSYVLILLF